MSFDSYIKPQHSYPQKRQHKVVFLLVNDKCSTSKTTNKTPQKLKMRR